MAKKNAPEAPPEAEEVAEATETPPEEENAAETPAEAKEAAPDDLQAALEELRAQVKSLTAEKEAAEATAKADAEAARQAALSDAERLAEERAAWQAEVEGERGRLKGEARAQALAKMGVLEKFAAFAPDVDVRDKKGQAELEKWAKENPELLAPRDQPAASKPDAAPGRKASTKLQEILSGKRKSMLVSRESIERMANN